MAWNGSIEAQRQADEAFRKWTSDRPSKKRSAKKSGRFYGTYHQYLKSSQWKKKRLKAIKLAGGKCSACGSLNDLQVHHKHYKTLFQESPKNDLVVFCAGCHQNHHESDGKAMDPVTREFVALVKSF